MSVDTDRNWTLINTDDDRKFGGNNTRRLIGLSVVLALCTRGKYKDFSPATAIGNSSILSRHTE